jgi:hypothetical protein
MDDKSERVAAIAAPQLFGPASHYNNCFTDGIVDMV